MFSPNNTKTATGKAGAAQSRHGVANALNFVSSEKLNNLQPQKIMKLNQIGLAFVLPLAVMLAVTGCKHNYKGKTTMLPDHGGGQTSTPTSTPTDQTQPNFDTKPINQQDNTATSTSTPYK